MDWILRTSRPVWHLYLREPLTIGLYRAVYLLTGSFLTPREIISGSPSLPECGVYSGFSAGCGTVSVGMIKFWQRSCCFVHRVGC